MVLVLPHIIHLCQHSQAVQDLIDMVSGQCSNVLLKLRFVYCVKLRDENDALLGQMTFAGV